MSNRDESEREEVQASREGRMDRKALSECRASSSTYQNARLLAQLDSHNNDGPIDYDVADLETRSAQRGELVGRVSSEVYMLWEQGKLTCTAWRRHGSTGGGDD